MSKVLRVVLAMAVVAMLGATLFAAGFVVGRVVALPGDAGPAVTSQSAGPTPEAATPANLESTFAPFWQAWDLVHQEYVDQPVDDVKLMQGAIGGSARMFHGPRPRETLMIRLTTGVSLAFILTVSLLVFARLR
jgi:carboxyl-terminal processing protease